MFRRITTLYRPTRIFKFSFTNEKRAPSSALKTKRAYYFKILVFKFLYVRYNKVGRCLSAVYFVTKLLLADDNLGNYKIIRVKFGHRPTKLSRYLLGIPYRWYFNRYRILRIHLPSICGGTVTENMPADENLEGSRATSFDIL